MSDADLVPMLLRATLGIIFIAHGYNHGWGPGGISGTAGWFESIGLRPARLQAIVSSWLEILIGIALLLGLLIPLAAAGGIGVMTVAFVTVHRPNGFFIIKEGFEYVLLISVSLAVLAMMGGGTYSLDEALNLERTGGWIGAAAAAAGIIGAGAMLSVCWRPRSAG